MRFDGTFTIEGVTAEEVWLALSDPVMIKNALPGCQFLTAVPEGEDADFDKLAEEAPAEDPPVLPEADPEDIAERAFVEGGRYAAVMQVGVGSVKPRFETVVTIERREFPEMEASGEGSSSNSSFEMEARMNLTETDEGVNVEWEAETDVFGRIAQMGQRVMNPVANRVVGRFFSNIEDQLSDVSDSSSLTDRVRDLF
ncbi:MAG: CoxG family protein [Salinigranum sp.]